MLCFALSTASLLAGTRLQLRSYITCLRPWNNKQLACRRNVHIKRLWLAL